ncbi:FadR/GntR family transcriptional regulator [Nocardia sp. 004]|uniref:FadR/GntR family transcriptional regulator n=1 Tax=Nocardia sp. 004 TaxID=3385978 RepID=UPI00399FC858
MPATAGRELEEELRRQIAAGELPPGHQLPTERELSTHYGVSRNTAREALRALASQGLLEIKRGVTGGTFVATPTAAEVSGSLQTSLTMLVNYSDLTVADLLQVREILEVPAAEIAALHRTDDELDAIRGSLFGSNRPDPATVFTETSGFHLGIIRATHNPLLEIVADPVFRILDERFTREKTSPANWEMVEHEHREILGYLDARDQAGAREAMRAHLRGLRGLYEEMKR